MAKDEFGAVRGWGKQHLIPENGLPFALDTGEPVDHQPPALGSLSTRGAMNLIRWDYDPVAEALLDGDLPVRRFFEHVDWSAEADP